MSDPSKNPPRLLTSPADPQRGAGFDKAGLSWMRMFSVGSRIQKRERSPRLQTTKTMAGQLKTPWFCRRSIRDQEKPSPKSEAMVIPQVTAVQGKTHEC